jgi:hypothetical protein
MSNVAPKFLTKREKDYIRYFVLYGDERKALREVFGTGTPIKKHDEIFAKPLAQKYYRQMLDDADASLDVSARLAVQFLNRALAVNIADILDPTTGAIRDDIPEEYFDAVQSIKFDPETGGVTQINTVNKMKAAETVLKMKGAMNQQVDVNVNVSLVEQLKSSEVADEEVDALLENFFKSSGTKTIDAEVVEDDA